MSYLIKLHSTPVVVDSVLNNAIHCGSMYHSLSTGLYHPRLIFRNNFEKFSTEPSCLLVKRKVLKTKQNYIHQKRAIVLQNLTRIMDLKHQETKKRKRTVLKSTSTSHLRMKNNFDSTKSYDPNLLDSNLEVKEVFSECDSYEYLQKNNPASIEMKSNKLKEQPNLASNTSENIRKPQNKLSENSDNYNKNLSVGERDMYRFLNKTYSSSQQTVEEPLVSNYDTWPSIKEKIENFVCDSSKNDKFQKYLQFDNLSDNKLFYMNRIEELHAIVDIFITRNSVLDAYEMMKIYRKKSKWKDVCKTQSRNLLNVYNLLLEGLSEKGYWNLMQEVVRWMKQDYTLLDPQSYSALLYCLAEFKDSSTERLLHKTITELFVNGYSLNDIFTQTVLTKEKVEKILLLIQKAIPQFDIQPIKIDLSSDCPLVKDLQFSPNNLESPISNVGLETLKNLVDEQLQIEKKFIIPVKAVVSKSSKMNEKSVSVIIADMKEKWCKTLEESIEKAVKMRNLKTVKNPNIYIFLDCLPPNMIAKHMVQTACEIAETACYSSTTSDWAVELGSRICNGFYLSKTLASSNLERLNNLLDQYMSWYYNPSGPARNARQKWQMLIQECDKSCHLDLSYVKWPFHIKKQLGKFLLDSILNELKFVVEEKGRKRSLPVFCVILRWSEGVWREEIRCHPVLAKLFKKNGSGILYFRADHLPMVCPPKPWKSANHGGYLIFEPDLIRRPMNTGKTLEFTRVPQQNLYPTLDSLNALQGIPWKINVEVLDLIIKVFEDGGSKKLSVPVYPEIESPTKDNKTLMNMKFQDRLNFQWERKLTLKKNAEDYSLWCEALYRLSLANHFRNRTFWLPQNCDFRGRVYPIPPLINHLGSDMYRSLMIFAKGKPLGPRGLDWLKIHLINLTGTHKRRPNNERLAYANKILPLILDSAERPFTGNKWWMDSEEPWQTLAACIEIKKAVESPDPENYICHFPVHQDGSCNGLQHYAALGKDVIGAKSVNLSSQDTPQDVYSVVAKLIDEERAKDEERGCEIAKLLRGFVNRKVIKQTVMTTVYGVTIYGAKNQITRRLEELPDFPQNRIQEAATYLTEKTFFCLRKMFTSAKEIQDWFVRCADSITKSKKFVQWVTPLGLPVLQGYGRTKMNSTFFKVYEPDHMKQRNAFPPNFIHSLDSSHMMLTALFCEQEGITFAAVHDCFWTHPISVDILNRVCREQFISLHSQPLLENLSQFFIRQYLQNDVSKNNELMKIFEAVPSKGSFNLNEVLNSVYFFS